MVYKADFLTWGAALTGGLLWKFRICHSATATVLKAGYDKENRREKLSGIGKIVRYSHLFPLWHKS